MRLAYDALAEQYAELFLHDVDRDPDATRWLDAFARLASPLPGMVADLGCGPGHVVAHLCRLGVNAVGYDLSPGQIAEARKAFPSLEFRVGDFADIDAPDSMFGGIVSRYSVIHTAPPALARVFGEWKRVLLPEAPLLLSFFGSATPDTHGTPFDHKVVTPMSCRPRS